MSRVTEVAVPTASRIMRSVGEVHFCDAYEAPLGRHDARIGDIYNAVFGQAPGWITGLLKLRGRMVAAFGLKHPSDDELQSPPLRTDYQVGQRAGIFTVQSVEPNELIAGDNDKHLDFRVSIFRAGRPGAETVTVSTVVRMHNALGRAYLFFVKPFHRVIVRTLLQRAVDAGRL